MRRPKGYLLVTGPVGVEDEGETLQCVHCGMHWRVQPGSGRQRGYCMNCDGPTCGKKVCMTKCVPAEKKIQEMEGRAQLHRALEHNKQK